MLGILTTLAVAALLAWFLSPASAVTFLAAVIFAVIYA